MWRSCRKVGGGGDRGCIRVAMPARDASSWGPRPSVSLTVCLSLTVCMCVCVCVCVCDWCMWKLCWQVRSREQAGKTLRKEHTQRITAIVKTWIHYSGAYCHDNCFCSMAESRQTARALITRKNQAFLPRCWILEALNPRLHPSPIQWIIFCSISY